MIGLDATTPTLAPRLCLGNITFSNIFRFNITSWQHAIFMILTSIHTHICIIFAAIIVKKQLWYKRYYVDISRFIRMYVALTLTLPLPQYVMVAHYPSVTVDELPVPGNGTCKHLIFSNYANTLIMWRENRKEKHCIWFYNNSLDFTFIISKQKWLQSAWSKHLRYIYHIRRM